jgi:hypothetical protein
VWRGVEIYLPTAMFPPDPGMRGVVRIDLPAERIVLDVPHPANEQIFEPFEPVTLGGDVRAADDGAAIARRLRGHLLFVQLQPDRPMWSDGPPSMRPSTVSDVVVPGVTNLAAVLTRIDEDGHLWLDAGSHVFPVPADVAQRARPRLDGVPVDRNGRPMAMRRGLDPGVFAVLKVLPSGRSALVALIVDGKRY